MAEQELEQLEGTVEDIIYENADNGYTVFEVSGGGVITVVCGVVGELHAGESVICRGRYENHATYGRQFHAQECETDMPKDLEAVYAFLASRSLPYIGAKTADKIIDLFGAEALEVIANDPARLTQVPGISPDKADRIQQEFKRMFGMRELIAYLAQFEIGPRKAMEVFRTFGTGAMQAISANPYLLCGEPLQLDFRHADSIAQYYHMEGDCAQRLEAALLRTLRHNAGNGHTCLPRAQLLETASNFIHQPPEKLARALDKCIETEELCVKMFDGVPYIYLPDLLAAEQDIAHRLAILARRGKNTARDLDRNLQVLELTQGFAYAPLQREAIRKAMTENCLVLTGGPGTGKTTTVNAILQLLENQAERVALCAPTGRAAKRLSELTGRKASTIHRLLEVDYTGGVVSFIHNDKNLLKCDVVILDEMSMVDVKLFQALVTALRYSCRIIMVGDADQLPSVGPGNLLGEMIRSGCVPTVCLNEIFRQAKRSLIVENAHHIICGEPLQKGGKTDDFFFLEADGDAAQKLVCDLVTTRLPRSYGFDPVRGHSGALPHKAGPHRHPGAERGAAEPAQPGAEGQTPAAERGPGVPGGRQGDAGAQQLRDRLAAHRRGTGRGSLQRRHRHRGEHQHKGALHGGAHGRPAAGVPGREPQRTGDRLRHHGAQEPGQRVPGGDPAGGAGAAPPLLPQPVLHRRHPRTQAVHRGGSAGRGQPHDEQCAPEPALQRPVRPAAGGAAAGAGACGCCFCRVNDLE